MSDDLYFGVISAPEPVEHPTQIGTWRVMAVLGSGATADVYAVEHVHTARRGALKRLRPGPGRHRFRNELLGLGVLELPGVVRVLDDGMHDGAPYLVEDRVEGTAFPGLPAPEAWYALAPRVASLLLALERLHRAGIYHLDLKPENALVGADGQVTLVDLGLCQGPALGERPTPEQIAAGTDWTMSPEQRAGEPVDGRSDLYAVGRILSRWLRNRPHPPYVGEVVRQLCAELPVERPRTALAVLVAFDMDPVRGLTLPLCVNGSSRLLHVPEDVSNALASREGSLVEIVRDWVCVGDATIDNDGSLSITPLGRRKLHGHVLAEVDVVNLERRAQEFEASGQLSAACRCLGMLAVHARWQRWEGAERTGLEAEVLTRWFAAALRLEDLDEVERVGYAVSRVPDAPPGLVVLAQAAVALVRGRPEETRLLLEQRRAEDGRWDGIRHRLRVQAAAGLHESYQRRVLDDAADWAARENDDTLSQVEGWRAHQEYRMGRYAEAAALHERALALSISPPRRVSAALNAASCWMETGAHERADDLARNALPQAARLRHLVFELRAEWLIRSIAYRDGRTRAVDAELLDAAAQVEHLLWRGLVRLNEAAVAWRAGDGGLGTLAHAAREDLRAARQPRVALLADALVAVATRDTGAAATLVQSTVEAEPHDDLTWQIAGILHICGLLGGDDPARAARLARNAADPGRRRELVSPREVLDLLN